MKNTRSYSGIWGGGEVACSRLPTVVPSIHLYIHNYDTNRVVFLHQGSIPAMPRNAHR